MFISNKIFIVRIIIERCSVVVNWVSFFAILMLLTPRRGLARMCETAVRKWGEMLNLSKKILVAIDGSPASDKAAEEAVRLASATSTERFRSTLYAVIVLPSKDAPALTDLSLAPARNRKDDWEERQRRIFYVVDKAASEGNIHLRKEIIYGEIDEAILDFAAGEECDVIVIGSTGKGRMLRALRGSISARVALNARCSVYIVR
jgi:nucleotide-binding universal stress UspA family protein